MPNPKSCFSIFRALFFMAIATFGLASCAGDARIKRPPITTPIKLDQAGIVADFNFEVREHLLYEYDIRFKFPENDPVERARVRKILGGHEVDKEGKPLKPGTPTPIKLTIFALCKEGKEVEIYSKDIDPILTSWGGDWFGKNIGANDLPLGIYKIRLENKRASSEFSTIPITFGIEMDKFKFTFDPKESDRSKSCPQ